MTNDSSNTTFFCSALSELGFSRPTAIQEAAIPPLSRGESLLALAPTGSGKTLAFLIPLMEKLDSTLHETQLLILAPTRELGLQIAQVAQQLSLNLKLKQERQLQVRSIFGGHKAEGQKIELLKNPAVVIATPGRALDLIKQNVLDISCLKSIVLDEADLMVGMGFEEQIRRICDHLPNKIQAALFSATESEGQNRLVNRLVHRGLRIDMRSFFDSKKNTECAESNGVTHEVVTIPSDTHRLNSLAHLIMQLSTEEKSGIIFCETRDSVQRVVVGLKEQGILTAGLSGELGQVERSSIMRRFKAGGVKFLVATNVAARGIDVSSLSTVIHFELPSTQQEYVHRSGRTGRAGKSGRTISLCTPQNRLFLRQLLEKTDIKLIDCSMSHALSTQSFAPRLAHEFVKIHINRGKSNKLRPADILGALTKDLGLDKTDVGGIFIFDHFTHVEISRPVANTTLHKLSGRKIKNLIVKASTASALSAPRERRY